MLHTDSAALLGLLPMEEIPPPPQEEQRSPSQHEREPHKIVLSGNQGEDGIQPTGPEDPSDPKAHSFGARLVGMLSFWKHFRLVTGHLASVLLKTLLMLYHH